MSRTKNSRHPSFSRVWVVWRKPLFAWQMHQGTLRMRWGIQDYDIRSERLPLHLLKICQLSYGMYIYQKSRLAAPRGTRGNRRESSLAVFPRGSHSHPFSPFFSFLHLQRWPARLALFLHQREGYQTNLCVFRNAISSIVSFTQTTVTANSHNSALHGNDIKGVQIHGPHPAWAKTKTYLYLDLFRLSGNSFVF